MPNFEDLLRQLLCGSRITKLSLKATPKEQGAYILWLGSNPPVCLKVGVAGPRQGEGLLARLRNHFSSNPDISVLARHMAADSISEWTRGYNFQDREQRKKFLAEKCYFQVISLPDISRITLEQFEDFVEDRLKPKYAGSVKKASGNVR
jgi:hypothetical protein